jgi:MraZ protein
MLLGSSNNRIDGKGRLVMPAKFRSKIGEIVCCTVSRNRSLAVYPMDEWAPYYEKIQALPSTDEALKFKRFLLGNAEELPVDGQGRILIPEKLRKYANLVDQVVVNGAGDHLEIWNSESWSAYNDENLENFDAYSEEVGAKYGL